MSSVEIFEVGKVVLLWDSAEMRSGVEVWDAGFLGADGGALIYRGQPALRPVAHAEDWQSARIREGDVRGQLLRFGAESVGEPAPESGTSRQNATGLERVDALAVVADSRFHASEERDFVNNLREVGQEFAYLDAGLPVFPKCPWAAEQLETCVGGIIEFEVGFELLSVPSSQFRFWVEEIHVAGSALHEQGNHGFGARLGGRKFGKNGVTYFCSVDGLCDETVFAEEVEEGD